MLKPGSIACFTVWGRRSQSLMFTAKDEAQRRDREGADPATPEVFEDPPREEGTHSNFDVGRDINQWLEVFREAGFN